MSSFIKDFSHVKKGEGYISKRNLANFATVSLAFNFNKSIPIEMDHLLRITTPLGNLCYFKGILYNLEVGVIL
jgi:hypothetical protein